MMSSPKSDSFTSCSDSPFLNVREHPSYTGILATLSSRLYAQEELPERHLRWHRPFYQTEHPAVLDRVPSSPTVAVPPATVFVEVPVLSAHAEPIPDRLRRLVQKFDPVERDYGNRSLGKASESFVQGSRAAPARRRRASGPSRQGSVGRR